MLRCGQTLVLAGCFSGEGEDNAWILKAGKIPEASSGYQCNAEEADSRIWRHATQTPYTHILIYSPDTDVYNIGLGVIQKTSKQYVIQLNVPHAAEKKFLNLNRVESVLYNDPDLASLPRTSIVNIMQTLFICTGCNYVSYFKSTGKSMFFNHFFQYCTNCCNTCLFSGGSWHLLQKNMAKCGNLGTHAKLAQLSSLSTFSILCSTSSL